VHPSSIMRARRSVLSRAEGQIIMYYLYLLLCDDNSIYTGITTDVKRRFQEHSLGKGGSYTKTKKVKKLLYIEECESRSTALKREAEIKSWRKEKKLALIYSN
jgi:putative endonuclease